MIFCTIPARTISYNPSIFLFCRHTKTLQIFFKNFTVHYYSFSNLIRCPGFLRPLLKSALTQTVKFGTFFISYEPLFVLKFFRHYLLPPSLHAHPNLILHIFISPKVSEMWIENILFNFKVIIEKKCH